MNISVNGKPLQVDAGATLADALTAASAPEKGIATAVNNTVVPAAERATTPLSEGDKILIIEAIYGG